MPQAWVAALFCGAAAAAGAQGLSAGAQGLRSQRGDDASVRPFTVKIADTVLQDLHERLADTRWPDQLNGADWTYGTSIDYLKALVAHWRGGYDWRAQERRINALPQFKTRIDGLDIHFIHKKSPEPNAFPILLLHGWPGTFLEFSKVLDPLSDPRRAGGDPKDAFHVVVASLPGFGFSERPRNQGHSTERTAAIFVELMGRLGYRRYGVQGSGDLGVAVATLMAMNDARNMAGLQLNQCPAPPPNPRAPDEGLTADEMALRKRTTFGPWESGYIGIQSTKPQTLGFALNDSPVGQAGWIVEKYRGWCDCQGNPETAFTKDELLTTVMIYWVTQTATSAARYFYESQHIPDLPFAPVRERIAVPTGCSAFPGAPDFTPRSWAEKVYNVQRFTLHAKGGRFAALEQPDVFTNEVRAFFRTVR
jgi:pimeloyl-ACP methyl ester carboxylesterase